MSDDSGNPGRHQQNRAVVVVLLELRNGFAAKTTDFAIGQDRLQAVAYFDPVLVVLDGKKKEDSVICRLAADAPLLEKRNCVALNIGAIQGIYGYDGDLRVRLLVDLLANVVQLRDGGRVKNVGEIVDVVRRLQLRDRLGVKQERQRQQDDDYPKRFHKQQHLPLIV